MIYNAMSNYVSPILIKFQSPSNQSGQSPALTFLQKPPEIHFFEILSCDLLDINCSFSVRMHYEVVLSNFIAVERSKRDFHY